tara:strand:+ start:15298 stop:15822 length:525 start_codon:yes stop_codon:yes gene_type:complete
MATPKRIPINRINKWFSHEDFNLEIEMGREALEGDGNFVVILYRVDRIMTGSDDIYGEASKDEIKYKPPVELRVIPIMNEPENKSYNTGAGSLIYLQDGPLEFSIYEAQLAELDVELNKGDYIGYPVTETEVRYFSVVNDGIKFYDNEHTIMGYKGAFRTVKCAPVDENEFTGH